MAKAKQSTTTTNNGRWPKMITGFVDKLQQAYSRRRMVDEPGQVSDNFNQFLSGNEPMNLAP